MGRVRWYNYLIGLIIMIGGYILSVTLLSSFISKLLYSGKTRGFIGINISFVIFLVIALIVTIFFNRVSIQSIVNLSGKIHYKDIAWGIGIWGLLLGLNLIIVTIFQRESVQITENYPMFLKFLLLSLLLTPFQVFLEEYIFRGYIVRLLESINKNRIFITLVSSGIFALLHMSNPEVKEDKLLFLLLYLLMAGFLTYLTLIKGGMEYAIGIHFANNYFAINFLNYPDSPLPSFPLFLSLEEVSPGESLISLGIMIALSSILIFLKERYGKKYNI